VQDALHRNESCGGHFRENINTEDGEAKRDDANYSYVAAWGYAATASPLFSIKSRSALRKSTWPQGATNNESDLAGVATKKRAGARETRGISGEGHLAGHVVPGNAGCGQ